MTVTKDMSIMEVVQKYPETIEVFMNSGMGCIGCAAAHFENIEQGALAHGIDIDSLRDAVGDMVKKRLHGELTSCADCAIACANPCNGPDAHFEIDPSKL